MNPPPIVFLGPSMALEEAREILDADYRPPIRRGDLEGIPAGTVVGIVDGEFDQSQSVSPREIVRAIKRGIEVFGSSSMGALRAAEVPAMNGVGRVFELYRSGAIMRDDEVALLFDPDTKQALTEPLVNVRYAIESLMRSDVISPEVGERLIKAAATLHYRERSYVRIMRDAGLADARDSGALLNALSQINLKRTDARALLLAIRGFVPSAAARLAPEASSGTPHDEHYDHLEEVQLAEQYSADAPFLIWETGDSVDFQDLILFMQMTGAFESYARDAVARFVLQGNDLDVECSVAETAAGDLLDAIARRWGWLYSTEVRVTLRDLGIGLDAVAEKLEEEIVAREKVLSLTRANEPEFLQALRAGLLMADLDLKRALLRCGGLDWLARLSPDEASPPLVRAARLKLCILNNCFTWAELLTKLSRYGIDATKANAFASKVARAREVAEERIGRLQPARRALPSTVLRERSEHLFVKSCTKHDESFVLSTKQAITHVDALKRLVGITRVSLVGELSTLGVQISQAARPDGTMSSTYGSGKGCTDEAAIVGGVMEETEKWALEKARDGHTETLLASFDDLVKKGRQVVNPAQLDLPYDSIYRPDLAMGWIECRDLISGEGILLPTVTVLPRDLHNSIMISARAGKRTNNTNGLASGFALEEALVHGICEVVERHAIRLAELRLKNPGTLRPADYHRIDLATLSDETRGLAKKIERSGRLALLDITSQVPIPTMYAVIVIERPDGENAFCDGFAAHPNPDVACRMAILEAAQSYIASIAGGREDLSFKARSLGRHERPRPLAARNELFPLDPDRPRLAVDRIPGFRTRDVLEELLWVVDAVAAAGLEHIAYLDITQPGMLPARAVVVKIPGVESLNPFHTGLHARLELLWDLVPVVPRSRAANHSL
jgi:ribosomal protein S12 methylthiotransferase accessory factor